MAEAQPTEGAAPPSSADPREPVGRVLDVIHFRPVPAQLIGASIDAPAREADLDVYAITIGGWVIGREKPVIAVEIGGKEFLIQRVPLLMERPDVTAHYPAYSEVKMSGFWTTVSILGLAPQADLCVQAVLEDETRVPFAVVRLRHRTPRAHVANQLQPLMVTALGRSGTTWLMRLVAEHPGIVACRDYPYEVRAANYWIHALRVLAEPADYHNPTETWRFLQSMSWIGHNPFYSEPVVSRPRVREWMGRSYVEELASLFQGSIQAFYERVAESQGDDAAIYFAEKFGPGHLPWMMWDMYPRSREVFLVRDFRDTLCSILAFEAKRKDANFGRALANSDEEFTREYRLQALTLLESWRDRRDRALLVRYEDLIQRPTEELSRIFTYMSLDASDSTIEGVLGRALVETPEFQEHRTSPNVSASIGRWRRDLDPSLQAVCNEAFGDILRELGYSA